MLVMEELGRGLVSSRISAAAVPARCVDQGCGQRIATRHVGEGARQRRNTVRLCTHEPGQRYERNAVAFAATAKGDGYVLNGKEGPVLGGDAADQLLVSATGGR